MIGLFDSGLGGLSVYRQLKMLLPHTPVVYVADTKRAPYGARTQAELALFSTQIIDFLQAYPVSQVFIGCNTVSANCYDMLRARYTRLPLAELIASGVSESVAASSRGIGYFATAASVNTGVFKQAVSECSDLPVYDVACPSFVPLVESGQTHGQATEQAVGEYLLPILDSIDTLVLGCTHYPFLADAIQGLIAEHNQDITLIDPAKTAVRGLVTSLAEQTTPPTEPHTADVFYTTGDTARFDELAYQLIGERVQSRHLVLES